jgi:ribosome-associated heat shock protein Hsp15
VSDERVRVDVWLWRARLFKTRSLAANAVADGAVYCEQSGRSRRLEKPSHLVGPGDGLSVQTHRGLRTVKILALGVRRGPPAEARLLYEESAPELDEAGEADHSQPD